MLVLRPLKQRKSIRRLIQRVSIASRVFEQLANQLKAKLPLIDADIAYNCLVSVPIYTSPALDLVNSLRAWIELQSHLDILKNVPQGYLYESIDLREELDKVYDRVENGHYYSEYDFQVDISSIFIRGRDAHFAFSGDLQTRFKFRRSFGLVSISQDGEAIPDIYVFGITSPCM
jgi:hypothetical protein